MVFSGVVFIFLPDSPMQARFLKGDDKLLAIERLRMNQMGISSGVWRWDHVKEAFLDWKTWIWFSLLTAVSIPSGGISTFGPLTVESKSMDKVKSRNMSCRSSFMHRGCADPWYQIPQASVLDPLRLSYSTCLLELFS